MKLFYFPNACSMASHITAREAGLALELEAVDLRTKTLASGGNFYDVNPKGYVPALLMDNGELLTESAVILQYVAELGGDATMFPPAGSLERYRVLETLNFIATEIHKGLGPLVNPDMPDHIKEATRKRGSERIALLEQRLEEQPYLMGKHFTIADAYAFAILRAARRFGIDFTPFPKIEALLLRIAERPAVQAAMTAEGVAE